MGADAVVLSRTTTVSRGGEYPSMMGLLPPRLDIHHGVLPGYFANPDCQLTMGMLLYDNDGDDIILIHPTKAPSTSRARIFPQEKVKYIRDGTLRDALLRGLNEELGLRPKDVHFHPEELFRFDNHLPLERTDGVPKTKCIVYFAARLAKWARITPNPKEVREVIRTNGDQYLDVGLASPRSEKCAAQTQVIASALDVGILQKKPWRVFANLLTRKAATVQ